MSLFKWSTPERRRSGRVLPIIPNEIYFCILEHIAARSTERPTPQQLQTLTNLSHVCRFFANFCLPRIFEFVEFSGFIFRDNTPVELRNDGTYKTSRESTLCTQIAAKQPLALALAKAVRVCHFSNWQLDEAGSWAVRIFARKYTVAMIHMTNIRELRFVNSFVDAEHWKAIATLPSLEELWFTFCRFLQGPADVDPAKRVKVSVPCARLLCCNEIRQPITAIDGQNLRVLSMEYKFFDQVNWSLLSALTELRLHSYSRPSAGTHGEFWERLHTILMQAPQSLEVLKLVVDIGVTQDVVQIMFHDPAWKNLPLLRSLTLEIQSLRSDTHLDASRTSSSNDCCCLTCTLGHFLDLGGYLSPPKFTIAKHNGH